jgi:hypothetical protein
MGTESMQGKRRDMELPASAAGSKEEILRAASIQPRRAREAEQLAKIPEDKFAAIGGKRATDGLTKTAVT